MKTVTLTVSILALTFANEAIAQESQTPQNDNSVFGVWQTARLPEEGEDKIAHIKVYPCKHNSNQACGKIVWSERTIDPATGRAPLDKENSEKVSAQDPSCA